MPPCKCGRPPAHSGRCNLVIDPSLVRQRLLDGATATDIAREFGRTAPAFRNRHVQPVIDQLTAEGKGCPCGQPYGHQFACPITMARLRRLFTEEQRTRATAMVLAGNSVRTVHKDLGLAVYSAGVLVAEIRADLAASGTQCACGKPIDHNLGCRARNRARRKGAFKFTSAAAAAMSQPERQRIAKLVRKGFGCAAICRRTGETEWRVKQLVAEMRAAGRTPDQCASCPRPFGHTGLCQLPSGCDCGRPRNHRGACRPRGQVGRQVKPGPGAKLAPEKMSSVKARYRAGESAGSISRATGVGEGVVQRLIALWRQKSHYSPAPCACGRPARHPGGCIKNTPGAIGPLERARIEAATRAGRLPHQIATELSLHTGTVHRHSRALRASLAAEGITCACGRPFGHPYWCSSNWDAHEQPRGRRPLSASREAILQAALTRGDPVEGIANAVGIGVSTVQRCIRDMPSGQKAERQRAMRARLARGRLQGDRIMQLVDDAVPRALDGALRADVVGELHLAVMEGRIEVEQVGAAVRSFVSRGLADWQSAYGPVSLDAPRGPDDPRSRGDTAADNTTVAELEQIMLGDRA